MMGYALIWINLAAIWSLWIANLCAGAARRKKRWPSVLILSLTNLFPLVAAGGLVMLGRFHPCIFYIWRIAAPYWFTLASVSAIIGLLIVWLGFHRDKEGAVIAAGWPERRLQWGLLGMVGLHFLILWALDREMIQHYAAVRAEARDLALSLAPVPVPDRQNAALLYERLGAMFPEGEEWPAELTADRWSSRFDSRDEQIREYLRRHRAALELIWRATELPDCRFEYDYLRPHTFSREDCSDKIGGAPPLLVLDYRVQAAEGNTEEALRDIIALLRMAGHIRSQPRFFDGLIAKGFDKRAGDCLENLLATVTPTKEDLQRLPLDDPLTYQKAAWRIARMEQAEGLSTFAWLSGENPLLVYDDTPGFGDQWEKTETQIPWPMLAYWRAFSLPRDIRAYQRKTKRIQAIADRPFYEEGEEKLAELEAELQSPFDESGPVTRVFTNVDFFAKFYPLLIEGDARRGLPRLAVAMTRYKIDHGEYPEKLDSLVPDYLDALPIDPFSGKPLKMVRADGGIVLYSVGRNGVDDQGQEASKEDSRTGDITFCLGEAYRVRRLTPLPEEERETAAEAEEIDEAGEAEQ